MSGGSLDREDQSDCQCRHCGRYYTAQGIDSHQANCELKDVEGTVVPLQDVEDEPHPVDRATDGGTIDDVDDVDQDDDHPTTTKLDPPTPTIDEDPDPDSDPDPEPCCPSCGSTDWFDPEDLPDHILDAQASLTEYDRVCHPCSTTDTGQLASQIEVYDT